MSNLKSCLDCEHKVSDEAESCPKCGRPDPSGTRSGFMLGKASLVICGFLVIMGMLNSLATAPGPLERKFQGLVETTEATEEAFKH